MDDKDREIMVCASCLQASCWHGEFMCDVSDTADVTIKTVGELLKLGLEHPDHFSKKKMREVYGESRPEFIR